MTTRVLITGGSRGIGRAIALALSAQGHEISLNYFNNHTAANDTLSAIQTRGGMASLLPFDVADREAAKVAIERDIEVRGIYWGGCAMPVSRPTRRFRSCPARTGIG